MKDKCRQFPSALWVVVGLAILLLIRFIPVLTQSILGPTLRATEVLLAVGQVMKHLPNSHIVPRNSLPGSISVEFFYNFARPQENYQDNDDDILLSLYVMLAMKVL